MNVATRGQRERDTPATALLVDACRLSQAPGSYVKVFDSLPRGCGVVEGAWLAQQHLVVNPWPHTEAPPFAETQLPRLPVKDRRGGEVTRTLESMAEGLWRSETGVRVVWERGEGRLREGVADVCWRADACV